MAADADSLRFYVDESALGIRTRPAEIQRLKEAGLRVFRIGGKRDLATWDWLVRIVRNWERMEEVIETQGAGPWFYSINEHGLTRLRRIGIDPPRTHERVSYTVNVKAGLITDSEKAGSDR